MAVSLLEWFRDDDGWTTPDGRRGELVGLVLGLPIFCFAVTRQTGFPNPFESPGAVLLGTVCGFCYAVYWRQRLCAFVPDELRNFVMGSLSAVASDSRFSRSSTSPFRRCYSFWRRSARFSRSTSRGCSHRCRTDSSHHAAASVRRSLWNRRRRIDNQRNADKLPSRATEVSFTRLPRRLEDSLDILDGGINPRWRVPHQPVGQHVLGDPGELVGLGSVDVT